MNLFRGLSIVMCISLFSVQNVFAGALSSTKIGQNPVLMSADDNVFSTSDMEVTLDGYNVVYNEDEDVYYCELIEDKSSLLASGDDFISDEDFSRIELVNESVIEDVSEVVMLN